MAFEQDVYNCVVKFYIVDPVATRMKDAFRFSVRVPNHASQLVEKASLWKAGILERYIKLTITVDKKKNKEVD